MPVGETLINDALRTKLEPWLNHPPDYYDMQSAYKQLGALKAVEIQLLRNITKVEEAAVLDIDKIRSNDAKKAKQSASSSLRDELTKIQCELVIIEASIKTLEFKKTMFNAANFRAKMQFDFA